MPCQVAAIPGLIVRRKPKIADRRGWFLPALDNSDPPGGWLLQNIARSHPGVLRGMHFQDPEPQTKLLTLIEGSVQDIVADLRPDSPTYLTFAVHHLEAAGENQLLIPKGCAHGFLVTGTVPALFSYLADAPYRPDCEKTLRWDHPDWSFPLADRPPHHV